MNLRRALFLLVCFAAGWSAFETIRLLPAHPPAGVLVPDEPQQRMLEGPPLRFVKGHFILQAQAQYRIRGRLLHRERYRSDASAGVSPLDFALGWGPMSDSAILDQIEFSQSVRFLSWHWDSPQPPIPFEALNSHASNNHLIPADGAVFAALNRMREGQVVELSGYLVKVSGPDGFAWSGSLTRTDMGAGACEIIYVQAARIITGKT